MGNFSTLLVPKAAANIGSNLFIRHVLRFHKLSYPTLRNQLLNSAGITISNVSQKTYRGSVLSVLWYCCKYHRRLGLGGKQALNQSRRIFSFGFRPILGIQRHSRPWKPPAILLLALLYPLLKYYFGFLTKKRDVRAVNTWTGSQIIFLQFSPTEVLADFHELYGKLQEFFFPYFGDSSFNKNHCPPFYCDWTDRRVEKNWWEGMLFCKNHYHMVKN